MISLYAVLLFGFGESPIGFVMAAILLLMLARMLYGIIKDGFNLGRTEVVKSGGMNYSNESETAIAFQLGNFSYFRKLSPRGKTDFIHRVLNFMSTHSIEGEGDYEPGLPAKIHVAAAATDRKSVV